MSTRVAIILCVGAGAAGLLVGLLVLPAPTRNGAAVPGSNAVAGAGGEASAPTNAGLGVLAEAPISAAAFESEFDTAVRVRSPGRREAALYELGRRVALPDIPQALAFLVRSPRPEAMTLAVQLLRRWAEADPAAAIAFAKSLPRLSQRARLVGTAWEEWEAADHTAAVQWLSGLPSGRETEQWQTSALELLAAQDPNEALRLAGALEIGPRARGRLQAGILTRWAETDPAGAAAAARELKDLPLEVTAQIAYQWAMTDPKPALAWAEALASKDAQHGASQKAMEAWAGVDGQAALSYVISLSAAKHPMMLESAIKGWAAEAPEAAMKWGAAIQDAGTRALVLPWMASACAEVDASCVAPYLQSLTPNLQRDLASRVTIALIDQGPDSALEFAQSLPEGDIRTASLSTLFNKWAPQDLAAALAAMNQLPPGPDSDAALRGVLAQWAKQDPQAAAAWVQALPPEGQGGFLKQLAGYWASEDPAAAAAWAACLPDGPARGDAEVQVASHWADFSLPDAEDYVANLPPGPAQDEAAKLVVDSGMAGDADAVREWVSRFPPGQLRQELVFDVTVFWAMAMSDLPGAIDWVDKTFQGEYPKIEEDLARQWLALNRQTALQWIQSSSLPDEAKHRLVGR